MWSFYIGSIWGIKIRIHVLFLVLLAIIVLLQSIYSAISVAFVFVFVLLHELGHAIIARHYGLFVQDITLWPLGGMTKMEAIPKNWRLEIKIALAGPMVNFILALIFAPLAVFTKLALDWNIFVIILGINVILAFFNIIPAFPLDGGKAYRAWLARNTSYLEATRMAVQVGIVSSIVLCCLGILFGESLLILLCMFLIVSGHEELRLVEFLEREHDSFYFS